MTRIRRGLRAVTLLLSVAASAGCAAQANTAAAPTPQTKPVAPEPPQMPQVSFAEWRVAFRGRALAQGIRPEVFDSAFAGVEPNMRVVELDRYQPEFARPIWEYLDSAVSDSRISTGRRLAAERAAMLGQIEVRYGVDREVVLAIWGLESAYGANYGSIPVIESLATLAYEGRRRDFAEAQLVAALRILQSGDIVPARMVGSWAGAMGHTQFIPTSFLDYAVDFTGDGRRDIWAADAGDALASTANYLSRFGWTKGAPVAVEVRLPASFDFLAADESTRRPAAAWSALGVSTIGGGALPAGDDVSILLPAGAAGPAFAAYPNFGVIRRYNNATSYALAVGHLAERIRGAGPYVTPWPRGDRPLSRNETIELQERLTALGHDTQGVDGIVGPNTRAAIRAFQVSQGMTPDGYLSAALLTRVRASGG
ncbi:lytic murein transglycosylase [Limibaculum sp. M0105]|uniref:Lytic murein transglycosylase n=1 Tax=Thermohalobaculum xanthum TaxID=2753746 RepID=A0A8J7MAA0_9RHOB|nr:lytic murein transglycosylase [Thermohalobaculum xanthum]MBK0400359.1 lytic murein transglycosylase [Thermohalobaculum xanthum]